MKKRKKTDGGQAESVVVVRPNKSSEMKVSEVSPYRNMRCEKGKRGTGTRSNYWHNKARTKYD